MQKSGAWLWAGVALLTISVICWPTFIFGVRTYRDTLLDMVLVATFVTIVPIWVGVYCLRRGLGIPGPAQGPGISWLIPLMLLLPLMGALESNLGILVWLGIVAFMVGFGAIGLRGISYSPRYGEGWRRATIVRVFSYAFAPFAGALITVNVGSYVFGSAWSSSGILRWFFILLGEVAAVLLVYWGSKTDEAEKHFREAKTCSDPSMEEFDLDSAIRLLEEAVRLKPDKKQYHQKLDETREIKAKRRLKFSMQVQEVSTATFSKTGATALVIEGRVEQGTIRNGDEIQISGPQGTRRAKVFLPTRQELGIPGKKVRIAIEGLTKRGDVRKGDLVEKV